MTTIVYPPAPYDGVYLRTIFDPEAGMKPLPPIKGMFDGLVMGRNETSFTRVEHITNACRTQGRVENLALIGVPSSGKTTTAQIIAKALGRPFFEGGAMSFGVKPSVIEDLGSMITAMFGKFPDHIHKQEWRGNPPQVSNLIKPAVIFLDEAHQLSPKAQTLLLLLMAPPHRVCVNNDWMLDCSQIMWILGTTDFSLLQVPLQTRMMPIDFVGYAIEEVALMIKHRCPVFTNHEALLIARAGKGFPRSAFKIADTVAAVDLTKTSVEEILHTLFGVDDQGLDMMDQDILTILRCNHPQSHGRRLLESKSIVLASNAGKRVGQVALTKAQAHLDSMDECVPLSQGALCEKLRSTDQSGLFRRLVYLESLNLITRTSRGPMAIV